MDHPGEAWLRKRGYTNRLADRDSPLQIAPARFREIGHQLVDQIAGLLESIPDRPVTRDESPSSIREALGLNGALPEHGADPAALLATAARLLADHSLFNGHPRFFGYITSSPAPIGMLADLLASALNPNVGGWLLSPAATEVEAQTIRWIAELISRPRACQAEQRASGCAPRPDRGGRPIRNGRARAGLRAR